ncbi:MAG: hypothetical protein WBC93_13165 [Sulfitobacter sp.]
MRKPTLSIDDISDDIVIATHLPASTVNKVLQAQAALTRRMLKEGMIVEAIAGLRLTAETYNSQGTSRERVKVVTERTRVRTPFMDYADTLVKEEYDRLGDSSDD